MEKAVLKQQRTENILSSLKKLDYLNRTQLQILHRLGSVRNTNHVLKQLNEYLSSFRDGECVYYLNKEGREMVNAKKIRKKTLQARHFIMRNYIYIAYDQPSTWKTEVKVGVKEDKKTSIICDALFERDKRYHIVEVDHMQKMSINRLKVKKYKQLIEYGIFGNTPHFIWITTTDYRKKQLEKYCEDLDFTIFTIKDFN